MPVAAATGQTRETIPYHKHVTIVFRQPLGLYRVSRQEVSGLFVKKLSPGFVMSVSLPNDENTLMKWCSKTSEAASDEQFHGADSLGGILTCCSEFHVHSKRRW